MNFPARQRNLGLHLLLAVAAVGLLGCAHEPAGALFEVPESEVALPDGFYSLPYPNDLRIKEDGLIDFTGIPRPNTLLEEYLNTIAAQQRGFGLTSALYLRFDGAISTGSLPADPSESRGDDASVYLVNIDSDSEQIGTRIPLQFRFEQEAGDSIGTNWLSALPYPGFVLAEETTYALVVTKRLRSADGGDVLASADFKQVMGQDLPEEAHLARAHQLYEPLHTYLDADGGDDRGDVVNAAVFTTQDATGLLGKLRGAVYRDVAAPVVRELAASSEITTGIVLYKGFYDSPIYQAGDYPYRSLADGGGFSLDPLTGEPILQGSNELRVSIALPLTPIPPNGWPVVLYGHGTGGDYRSYVANGTGRRLAEQGIAVVSIDQLMHGPRLTNGEPETTFFNFLNPLAARGNIMQVALEGFQLVRLVEGIQFVDADAEDREVRFDSTKIGYFGHSQGSQTGLPFVAHEPKIQGAVFSGAGGLLYLTMLFKTLPFDIPSIVALIVRDSPLDQFNPALALMQAFFEPADAISYGRLLVDLPPEGNEPKNILHLQGLTDRFTPLPSSDALATAIGLNLVAPEERVIEGLALRGKELLTAPISANVGTVTSVLTQYQEQQGSDGHFVAFDLADARLQSVLFLKTLFETGTAVLVDP